MSWKYQRRRIVLFAVAIVLPAVVLCGAAVRMAVQERMIAQKRAAEEQSRQVAALRSMLLVRLSSVLAQVREHWPSYLVPPYGSVPGEIAAIGLVEGGHWVLPWESSPTPARVRLILRSGKYGELAARAEMAEAMQPELAISHYRAAVGAAREPLQAAHAQLGLARVLRRTDAIEESVRTSAVLLHTRPEITDDQGVPFALYAALQLKRNIPYHPCGTPECAHLYQNLYIGNRVQEPSELSQDVARVESAESVRKQVTALPSPGLWTIAEQPAVLVTTLRDPPLAVAIHIRNLVPGPATLSFTSGEPVGPPFAQLGLVLPPPAIDESALLGRQTLSYGALGLVLAASLFSAWLLWRDARREAALARLRSGFVASVTHELKTPLTSIRMFAETLRLRPGAGQEQRTECLDTIIGESERLSRLVDNVLDFSRIEQERKTYRMVPVALGDAVGTAVRSIRFAFEQAGFRLEVESPPEPPVTLADADALQQAILNLLTNAMKYSGASRLIRLSLARENGDAVIRVRDDGIGIAAEHHARVLSPFYRVETPENGMIPGAGLGLTVVDHIAKAHGGRVEIESAPGAGSTFSLRIPLREIA